MVLVCSYQIRVVLVCGLYCEVERTPTYFRGTTVTAVLYGGGTKIVFKRGLLSLIRKRT